MAVFKHRARNPKAACNRGLETHTSLVRLVTQMQEATRHGRGGNQCQIKVQKLSGGWVI